MSRGPLGRAPPAPPTFALLDREGGVKVVSGIAGMGPVDDLSLPVVLDLWGRGGDAIELDRAADPASPDCARFSSAALAAAAAAPDSVFGNSRVKDARCCDKMDRFSSIGVKILCDFR